MSEIPGQSGRVLPDLQQPVCAMKRLMHRSKPHHDSITSSLRFYGERDDQSGARARERARATKFRITAERVSLRTARLIVVRGDSPFIGT